MRLIDADELITAFPCGESVRTECVRATINNMPTIEVIKEGEWMLECDAEGEGDNLYRCSECGQECGCQEYDLPNFCYHCGADMRGADDE